MNDIDGIFAEDDLLWCCEHDCRGMCELTEREVQHTEEPSMLVLQAYTFDIAGTKRSITPWFFGHYVLEEAQTTGYRKQDPIQTLVFAYGRIF
jgi:hypothetical protein